MRRAVLLVGLMASVCWAGPGCDSTDDAGGYATITLPYSGGDWFRLRVCDGPVATNDQSERTCNELYDTRCIEARSQTFELSGLPVGEDRTVLFESYTAADCNADAEIAMGFRGGVVITETQPAPYYYIPVYEAGVVTAMPENINISTSVSVKMDYCETAEECFEYTGESSGCFLLPGDDQLAYWCVPTCVEDADCAHLHGAATCDPEGITGDDESGAPAVLAGLCMLEHPYPLNMSTPRAFGAALPAPDGSVMLIGGFDRVEGGRLMGASRSLERFDGTTGLFARSGLSGPSPVSRGFSGVAQLSEGAYVVVGGSRSAALGGDSGLEVSQLAGKMCAPGADTCEENNLSAAVDLIDLDSGTITTGALPGAAVAPGVTAVDPQSFVVLGGLVNEDGNIDKATIPSDKIRFCSVDDGGAVSCVLMGEALTEPRVAPAAHCLDRDEDTGVCTMAAVVGGNDGAITADLLSFSGAAVIVSSLDVTGLPDDISGLSFCGDVFVGGGSAYTVEMDAGTNLLTFSPIGAEPAALNHDPATAARADGGCWVSGGWDSEAQTVSGEILQLNTDGVAPITFGLSSPRTGASAAVIQEGPLAGSLLVTGGLIPGEPTFVSGAEVLHP
ncbi:MAG: hypothetical protein VYE15_01595 [Myxococcota bacterium]|nr:hypothetical protein [Myxococcota bacterium]